MPFPGRAMPDEVFVSILTPALGMGTGARNKKKT